MRPRTKPIKTTAGSKAKFGPEESCNCSIVSRITVYTTRTTPPARVTRSTKRTIFLAGYTVGFKSG